MQSINWTLKFLVDVFSTKLSVASVEISEYTDGATNFVEYLLVLTNSSHKTWWLCGFRGDSEIKWQYKNQSSFGSLFNITQTII